MHTLISVKPCSWKGPLGGDSNSVFANKVFLKSLHVWHDLLQEQRHFTTEVSLIEQLYVIFCFDFAQIIIKESASNFVLIMAVATCAKLSISLTTKGS